MFLYRAQSLIYFNLDRNVYVLTVWLRKAPHHLVSLLWNYIYLQIKEKLPNFFFNSTPFKPQGRESPIIARQLLIIPHCILQGRLLRQPHAVGSCMVL